MVRGQNKQTREILDEARRHYSVVEPNLDTDEGKKQQNADMQYIRRVIKRKGLTEPLSNEEITHLIETALHDHFARNSRKASIRDSVVTKKDKAFLKRRQDEFANEATGYLDGELLEQWLDRAMIRALFYAMFKSFNDSDWKEDARHLQFLKYEYEIPYPGTEKEQRTIYELQEKISDLRNYTLIDKDGKPINHIKPYEESAND